MCDNIVEEAWQQGRNVQENISHSAKKLQAWSKEYFGSFAKEMKQCKEKMNALMETDPSEEVLKMMSDLDCRMSEMERREELYWHQRSRQEWIKAGDKNTKFFHEKTRQRRKRNQIKQIRDNAGRIYESEEQISEVLVWYNTSRSFSIQVVRWIRVTS